VINDRNDAALRRLEKGELPFIEQGAQPVLKRCWKGTSLDTAAAYNAARRVLTQPVRLRACSYAGERGLVLYVIEQLRAFYKLANSNIGLLGMAFKPEVDDIRASLSYKLKKSLLLHCKSVLTTDPLVKNDSDLLPAAQRYPDRLHAAQLL
jgi:UDP-glucose 6-dehydrogenase